jgi:hypothetical protein
MQYDGYPSWHGVERIATFILSGDMTNGFGGTSERRVFNGFDCFVPQWIAEHKEGPGNTYMLEPLPVGEHDAWQEFEYVVTWRYDEPVDGRFSESGEWIIDIYEGETGDNRIFTGSPQDLIDAVKAGTLKDY